MSGFDISKQAEVANQEDEGVFVHVNGLDDMPMYYEEDGEEKPVGIYVAGSHSTRYRRIEDQLRKRKIKPRQLTGEAIYDDNVAKAVACTLSWQGFRQGDEVIPLTNQNAEHLYKTCPWVYDQVLEAMHDHKRFFKSGSTQPQLTSDSDRS